MKVELQDPLIGMVEFVPTIERLLYGVSTVEVYLESEVERLNGRRVLVLAPRSLQSQPSLQRVSAILGKRLATTFSAAFEHVSLDAVIQAVAAARRCNADLIVAVGGGSVIDAAKALRTCLGAGLETPARLRSFMERREPLTSRLIPQLSIPTTLSGSEYTRSFSATDFQAGVKLSYTASAVAGKVIIYDPMMTMSTPMTLWLSSGVMAINHAVEVLCSSAPHLFGDAIKVRALSTLLSYLPRTMQRANDLQARLHCQIASWLADHSPLRTPAFKSVAAALPSHALAYELAALCRLPYGLIACLTLPAALRWMAARDAGAVTRQAWLARALTIASPDSPDTTASKELIEGLEGLISQLGLPCRFSAVNVSREHLQTVASRFVARAGSLIAGERATEDQVLSLLENAL